MIAYRVGACQLRREEVPLFGIMGSLKEPKTCRLTLYNNNTRKRANLCYITDTGSMNTRYALSGSSETVSDIREGMIVVSLSFITIESYSKTGAIDEYSTQYNENEELVEVRFNITGDATITVQ